MGNFHARGTNKVSYKTNTIRASGPQICLAFLCAASFICLHGTSGQEVIQPPLAPTASASTGNPSGSDIDEDAQPSTPVRQATVSLDPNASIPLNFHLTPELAFGAKLDLELHATDNLDLIDRLDDHLLEGTARLRLAMLYQPHRLIDLYAEGEWRVRDPLSDGTGMRFIEERLTLRRGYLLWREFLAEPLSLQIGRQRIVDDRQWLFDENLDAIRLKWEQDKFSTELLVSELLFEPVYFDDRPRSFDAQEALNVVLSAEYRYARKERVGLFCVFRHDDRRERDLAWIGGSWRGRLKRHKVWIDATSLVGDDRGSRVRAYAVDAGTVLRFALPWKPSCTFATAYGSGNFQQTGLQNNQWRFNGITQFRYYGEVVDPELSNLVITTAAFGVLPTENLSVDLVYHSYTLVEKRDILRRADIEEHLTGKSRDVGQAVELVIGYRIGEKIRGSAVVGCFSPGDAYKNQSLATAARLLLQVVF